MSFSIFNSQIRRIVFYGLVIGGMASAAAVKRDSTVTHDSIPKLPGNVLDTINPKIPESQPIQPPLIPGTPNPGIPGNGGGGRSPIPTGMPGSPR